MTDFKAEQRRLRGLALADARRQALEEAAAECVRVQALLERHEVAAAGHDDARFSYARRAETAAACALRIRALIDKEPQP